MDEECAGSAGGCYRARLASRDGAERRGSAAGVASAEARAGDEEGGGKAKHLQRQISELLFRFAAEEGVDLREHPDVVLVVHQRRTSEQLDRPLSFHAARNTLRH